MAITVRLYGWVFDMRMLVMKVCCTMALIETVVLADSTEPLTATSPNFHCQTYQGGPPAADMCQRCERLLSELREIWQNEATHTVWQPRCEIVLYSNSDAYHHAVGPAGRQTSGSTFIEKGRGGKIVHRQMDLLVGRRGDVPSLGHELTHVVLAEQFVGRQPPRWLDEGIAMLADSVDKRSLHYRDCRQALNDGSALRMVDLLNIERLTSARQVPAFYGQSLSLVRYFHNVHGEPGRLLKFAESAMRDGYDRALRLHYGIDGVADLERHMAGSLWNRHGESHAPFVSVWLLASIMAF